MNEIVQEWIDKAEADFGTAQREFGVPEKPNYDAVCFHAEQCIEKLMKGVLISLGTVPPKTHDLPTLERLLGPLCPSWDETTADLRLLTHAAVGFRYPGESAGFEEAQAVLGVCSILRVRLLALLS